ncbi:MAG TPA: patatin-like phospholipase family protein [Stellaceae bacterium]
MSALEVLQQEYDELHGAGIGAPAAASTLEEFYRRVHGLDRPRAALCLSGGGIRSACFALGVIQALARMRLLPEFHYLSTVSGGGYIGAFLSAWRRHEGADAPVFAGLCRRRADAEFAEPPQLGELRANSNFLTPRLGLLSADTWTATVLYLRNLLLNWFIFTPLFLGLLLVPHAAWNLLMLIWVTLPADLDWVISIAALVLLLGGLAVSVAGRPARDRLGANTAPGRRFAPSMRSVILFACLPIFGAAGFLAIFSAWLPPNPGAIRWGIVRAVKPEVFYPILYPAVIGALIYALAWLIGFFAGGGRVFELWPRRRPDDPVPPLAELFGYALSGAAAGAIVTIGIALYQHLSGLAEAKEAPALLNFFFGGYGRISMLVAVGVAWTMVAVFAADLLFTGLTSYHRNGDADREWSARLAGCLAAGAILWLIFAAIVLYGPWALAKLHSWVLASVGGASGLATLLLGGGGKTAATTARQLGERFSVTTILSIVTLVFALVLAVLLSRLALFGLDHTVWALVGSEAVSLAKVVVAVAAAVTLMLFSALVSYWVNVNRFSLHAVYRNRLIRAFLGAARAGHRPQPGRRNGPDPFTGFAEADNLPLAAVWRTGGNGGRACLFPVVNTTLNVVASANLAWQERKAEPFAMTPLACGNPVVGFVPTKFYGGPRSGITLGTAMAISGAAVSPNQGYHSSPIVGLLLTLFNVRLGWWLGNPRKGTPFCRRDGPWLGIRPVLEELLGLTDDQGPYVYLSDGGHFENLGLYEMVRRRCGFILISDAGSDPKCTLEDLGNAVRKIWIDLGVRVAFERVDVAARREPPADGVYCALGRILYPEQGARDGLLVYVKPGFHGSEPPDIRSYAALHQEFPHEGTGDQWFSESQMESYRGLGAHILEAMCGLGDDDAAAALSLEEFIERVCRYLERTRPQPT